ncbi:MAG: ATP-binding protein [Hyphomicrobiaceae bacterium]
MSDLDAFLKGRQALEALSMSQRLEALGQLASGIAHDFNNLLAVISGSLELAEAKCIDERAHRALRRAIDATELAARLNRRLHVLARKTRLDPRSIDLNARVSETTDLLRRTLGAEIAIETRLSDDLWPLMADPGEIDSAMLNVAANARDAMPAGGTITFTTTNLHLDGEAAGAAMVAPGDYVRLTIADTGLGMSQQILERAAEPFFTTKLPGTGLGLSSVQAFAELAGGFLRLSSAEGRGTTVEIVLPRASGASDESLRRVDTEPLPLGDGELLLVVGNDEQAREMLLSRLEALGYAVLEATDSREAIDLLQRERDIGLVLDNLSIRGRTNGGDITDWIVAQRPGLPVLLLSGAPDAAMARTDADGCALPILILPTDQARLATAVAKRLGRG